MYLRCWVCLFIGAVRDLWSPAQPQVEVMVVLECPVVYVVPVTGMDFYLFIFS